MMQAQSANNPKNPGSDVGYKYATINQHRLGAGEPLRVKQGQRILMRILNASATENIVIALPGHKFKVLAMDGNPIRLHWTPTAWFCLLYLAIIGSSLTFLLLYWLLPRMTVTNLQTISLITPPGAVAFGWLLGGETFTTSFLIGSGFVLVGVWMIFRRIEERAKPTLLPQEVKTAVPRG